MEHIAILELLRRHLWMINLLWVVAAVAGYAFSFLLPEQYEAAALVLVRPQESIKLDSSKSGAKEILDFPVGATTTIETPGKTYIEIIKSPVLIGDVVRKLGLDKAKEGETRSASGFISGSLKAAGESLKQFAQDLTAIVKYGSMIRDDPFTKAVKEVQNNLSQKALEDTYLFRITYTAKAPQLAADVANTTANLFINFMDGIRLSQDQNIHDLLQPELERSRRQLDNARERLESYKNAHSVFIQQSEYDAKLKLISDLELELAKAEAALVSSQNTFSTVNLAAKRERISRSLRERQAELAPLPVVERELKQLDQDVNDALGAYETINKEFRQASINYAYTTPQVALISQAVAPHLPSGPARLKIALASLVAGLVVGLGLAFLLEYLNRRVRSVHDVEDYVGVKVLATIPRVPRSRWRGAGL